MLFNSIEYLIFLPVVFLFYWLAFRGRRRQNLFIVVVSYIFYGWWDPRFLGLIFLASAVAYLCGLAIVRAGERRRLRRLWVGVDMVISFGILAVYKYYDFFATNLNELASLFGVELGAVTLQLVLPVGISFYTFQGVGYTIDVYRGTVRPCRNPVDFLAFISFFPQLVAGPIERASNLLPQFLRERTFSYAMGVDGMRQILWGLFKKMVVADNCAATVDWLFSHREESGGLSLLIGAVLFAFQIYCDFSGYSDIALGSAKLFGIRLMTNFRFPYFSRDIAEFWSRWHISLTTWFRDYLYIPLGGSRRGKWKTVRNTIIVFLVSGFWHDAGWTYITWGAFNAMLFVPLVVTGRSRRRRGTTVASGRAVPSLGEFAMMGVTFGLVVIGWVFYRAESMGASWEILRKIFTDPRLTPFPHEWTLAVWVTLLLAVEWTHRECDFGLQFKGIGLMASRMWRWVAYVGLFMAVLLCSGRQASFIYFQF